MKTYGHLLLLLGVAVIQVTANRIALDENAQKLCNKYKMMCKQGKVCAVQHFDWPDKITLPICIPLSFVPVRNEYCQLLPDTGRCHARYIRWFYNGRTQECSHFQYGGCEGNQNNFMSKSECEQTCMATPAIKLYDNGHSALIQPPVVSAPVYDTPTKPLEPLSSTLDESFSRHPVNRHKIHRNRPDEAANRTRRRLDKEKEKERERKRKNKERRRERKRLRRLRKKELKKQKRLEEKLKERQDKKQNNKPNDPNNAMQDDENTLARAENKNRDIKKVVKETKARISSELESNNDKGKREKLSRKERKRLKRRERRKRRLEKERRRRERLAKLAKEKEDEDEGDTRITRPALHKPDSEVSAQMFAILEQGNGKSKTAPVEEST